MLACLPAMLAEWLVHPCLGSVVLLHIATMPRVAFWVPNHGRRHCLAAVPPAEHAQQQQPIKHSRSGLDVQLNSCEILSQYEQHPSRWWRQAAYLPSCCLLHAPLPLQAAGGHVQDPPGAQSLCSEHLGPVACFPVRME